MRIIYTSNNQKEGATLSHFLKSKGIDNQFEVSTNQDWGSEEYGINSCHIWVIDEDTVQEALKWRDEFEKNPNDPLFKTEANPLKTFLEPLNKPLKGAAKSTVPILEKTEEYSKLNGVTLYTLITCVVLFFLAAVTTPQISNWPKNIPYSPLMTAPINKELMYDYPKAFEILDQVVASYGLEQVQEPENLPKGADVLINKFHRTPYYQGLYEKLIAYLQNKEHGLHFDEPMFEKIKEGEIWRLFTPALMHGSFFHILFNMILFVILGKQMEKKMGSMKLLLFILLTGIFSNTAQYIMTGTGFLGMSGVVCAMIGFIFMRQRYAAWEGYQFSSVSLSSVVVFVMLMLSLQIISFLVEIYFKSSISPGIANTAHLSGLFIGACMGLTNLFKLKN